MPTFTDDFERADGGLGSDWNVVAGSCSIASGYAQGTVIFTALAANLIGGGRHYASASCTQGASNGFTHGLVVKSTGSYPSGYECYTYPNAGNLWLYLRGFWDSAWHELASGQVQSGYPGTWSMDLEWDNGNLTAHCGSLTLTATDNHFAAGERAGFHSVYATTVLFNEVSVTIGAAATLTVTPDPIPNFGDPTVVTFTGTGTSWTPGNPGSPTFTVDQGTLTNQQVTSSTEATAVYDPGLFLGTATFTDPSTSAYDQVLVTSNPDDLPGQLECLLTPAGAALVNRTGALRENDHLLTDETVVYSPGGGAGNLLAVDAIRDLWLAEFVYDTNPPPGPSLWSLIWQILNGSNDPPVGPFTAPSSIPVAQHLDGITTDLSNLTGEGAWTLALLLGELAGPLGTNLSDLEADLGVHDQMAYASIVDAINVTRGPEMPTLTAILSAIEAINPGGTTDLTAVMDLLNFITSDGAVNLNSVLSTLATMRGDNSSTLHSITAQLTSALAKLDELKTYLQDHLGPMELTLAAIKATVDAILALLGQVATTRYQPPVWPGLAHVTMGAPQDIQGSLVVAGPMHGVCVNITSTDPGTAFFDYDVTRCWRNVGALAFATDRGDHEAFQPLGFQSAVYVPKTMAEAGSCKLHLGRGPRGTITPWTIAT